MLLFSQSFLLLPCSENCTPSFLFIFPRAVPCTVLCLLLVLITCYTNLDLSFPLLFPCNYIFNWLGPNETNTPISSYVLPLKGPSDWRCLPHTAQEAVSLFECKAGQNKMKFCVFVCVCVYTQTKVCVCSQETWHEFLLCIILILISHEK